MSDKEQVVGVLPRCCICGGHADYWCKNERTGESKYYCELCGTLHMMKFNDDWKVISFK